MNCFDVRFTPEAARVRGVHVLEGVEGLKVTPYDSSVWVAVLHLPLDMSEQVVVRTLGRFGKVTYEEPEFLEYKGVKTGTRRVRVELKSDIPSTLWANGHGAHIAYPGQPRTCWRCGLEGHEVRLCPNKRCSRCLQVGHTLAECKGDIVCNSCGKTGHLARLCPDAHTPREWLRAWLKRSLSRPLTPYHLMLLSSPQCPTLAPRWRLCSPFVSDLSPIELAETASLPTEAEQDKTAEMVLAEWPAAQDAAFTGSPVATPAIGDTSGPRVNRPKRH
ncbi:putative zinc finger CCHC domain-containing protein 3-like [Apostichopus japonicus]|uniref:Putative zinc finger CCHC domain-containing protein 3-like n=1 Tax=Stichopus japonicus TaxID=307972 RepID=A0A2G8JDP6_STIJA|nr:putative zinc finger CCHC domain-containing protein 3-like [Apostichopus japonicus]